MSNKFKLLVLGAAFVGAAGWAYWNLVLEPGELGQEPNWAMLQSVEADYRADPNPEDPIVLFKPIGYQHELLGIPARSAQYPRVWIILDETLSDKTPYILPQRIEFHLKCSYAQKLPSWTSIDAAVLHFLVTKCTL